MTDELAPTHTPAELAQAIQEVKAEILIDIQRGTVPADVPDFSALHDYVDANEYGGFCDDNRRSWWSTDELVMMQDVVNEWLKAGRDATWKLVGENTLTGNRWDCETGLTKAAAHEYRTGYVRLESDYKIAYRVEPE